MYHQLNTASKPTFFPYLVSLWLWIIMNTYYYKQQLTYFSKGCVESPRVPQQTVQLLSTHFPPDWLRVLVIISGRMVSLSFFFFFLVIPQTPHCLLLSNSCGCSTTTMLQLHNLITPYPDYLKCMYLACF